MTENESPINKEQNEYLKNKQQEEELQQKFKLNNIKILNEFKKIKNTYSDDIIPKIKHHKKFVNNSTKMLIGDETDQYELNFGKTKDSKNLKTSKSALDAIYISKRAKLLRRKINYHINKVKKSHEDITSLNLLFLDSSIFPEKNGTSLINNISIIKPIEKTSNYKEALMKKKLAKNFDLISDNYHKRLRFAFSKYNPVTYTNNLKKLLQISPEVRDNITKVKNEVEEDIKQFNDKHKFSKLFQKIKTTKNKRKQNLENFESININKSNDILKNFNSTNNNNNENKKIILPILKDVKPNKAKRDSTIKFGFIKKIRRRETRRLIDTSAQQFDEIKQLHNISKEIEKYIDNDNIDKKIDKNVHDFMEFKYYEFLKNRNQSLPKSIFKPKDYYLTQRNKIDGLVGDLKIKNIKDKLLEEERHFGRKLKINQDDYFNKMNSDMKSSLDEFDENMEKYDINLDKISEDK